VSVKRVREIIISLRGPHSLGAALSVAPVRLSDRPSRASDYVEIGKP